MRRGLVGALVAAYLGLWIVGIQAQRNAQSPIPLTAQQVQASLDEVYERAQPAAVRIETIPQGVGSGFFISPDGYVMTAYHVIDGANRVNVRTFRDEVLRAEVIGYDEPRDLAIIKVNPSRAVPFLELETGRALRPRDLVLNIGNSRGDFIAPRPGMVTRLDRTLSPFFPAGLVASTMRLAPGDSGGPILNDEGRVVGVAVAIGRDENGFSSYGAPLVNLEQRISELRAGAKRNWPYVGLEGIRTLDPDLAAAVQDSFGIRLTPGGVLFTGVGGGARNAGLVPTTNAGLGDLILEVDGKRVLDTNEFGAAVRAKEVGDTVTLTVRRSNGNTERIQVVLTANPFTANR